MSSALAEALADRLLQRFPPDRAYDRAALAEAARAGTPPLPRTVRHFLERMMTRRVEVERERLGVLRQPWLDYEHEEVRRAEEALVEVIRRHVRIPAEAWERVLRHACGRVAAHLVRPASTLENFVFGEGASSSEANGSDLLPARVVQRRLSYFAAYPYLREAVNAYVEQRDVAGFPRERLGALLHRVDEKMCDSRDVESWLRLLQPLFALGRAAYPNHDGLPVELLEAFFEEKKADLPLRRLRAVRRRYDLDALSPSALGEIIASSTPAQARPDSPTPPAARDTPEDVSPANDSAQEEAPPASPEPPETEPTKTAPPVPPRASEVPDRAADDTGAESPPLWKRFLGGGERGASEGETREGETREAERPSSATTGATGESDDARPRWQQFSASASCASASFGEKTSGEKTSGEKTSTEEPPASESDAEDAPALRPLEEEVLGTAADQRARFVRELFDGSAEAYERVLRRLRDAGDWQGATQIIARDVFRAHGVNIYGDPARSFTNAVEARFR